MAVVIVRNIIILVHSPNKSNANLTYANYTNKGCTGLMYGLLTCLDQVKLVLLEYFNITKDLHQMVYALFKFDQIVYWIIMFCS